MSITSRRRLVTLTVASSLALAGAIGISAEPAAAASPAPQLVSYTAATLTPTVNGLRIRSGPGTRYAAYGLLYRGDRMTMPLEIRRSGGGYWYKVRLTRRSASGLRKGFTGWVYASYLRRA